MAEAEKAFRLEIESSARLSAKAERYVAGAALAVGLPMLGPVGATTLEGAAAADRMLLLVAALLFAAGTTLALLAMRSYRYKTYPPGRTLIEILERAAGGGVGVHLQMAGIYLQARAANRKVNRRRAALLRWSSWALVVGFALIVGLQITRILH